MGTSGNVSSMIRKRALRRLGRERPTEYRALYVEVKDRAATDGETASRYAVRGRARTRLRYLFPDRYLELYADEGGAYRAVDDPVVRSLAWARATSALYRLRRDQYRAAERELTEDGGDAPYEVVMVMVRRQNEAFFIELLTDQCRELAGESFDEMVGEMTGDEGGDKTE